MTARTIRGGFSDAEPETHGGVAKRRLVLEGVTATRVSYAPGSRWSIDDAWPVGGGGCAFVELSHGTAEHFG